MVVAVRKEQLASTVCHNACQIAYKAINLSCAGARCIHTKHYSIHMVCQELFGAQREKCRRGLAPVHLNLQ